MRALAIFICLFPVFLLGQSESWLDSDRYRLNQGIASFFPRPLYGRFVSLDRFQQGSPSDIQWGLGARLSYVTEEDSILPTLPYRVGDRRFEKSLVVEVTSTIGMTFFYAYRDGADFAGRFRLEVPVGLAVIIGGGERLEKFEPIIEDGRIIDERPIWHKRSPVLVSPSLGLCFSYVHRISDRLALGIQWGYVGTLYMGGSVRSGLVLEFRR